MHNPKPVSEEVHWYCAIVDWIHQAVIVLVRYKRKIHIAETVGLSAVLALTVLPKNGKAAGNIWADGSTLAQVYFVIFAAAWLYGVWGYAKAKGQSGLWVFVGLTVIDTLILAAWVIRDSTNHFQSEKRVPC